MSNTKEPQLGLGEIKFVDGKSLPEPLVTIQHEPCDYHQAVPPIELITVNLKRIGETITELQTVKDQNKKLVASIRSLLTLIEEAGITNATAVNETTALIEEIEGE